MRDDSVIIVLLSQIVKPLILAFVPKEKQNVWSWKSDKKITVSVWESFLI